MQPRNILFVGRKLEKGPSETVGLAGLDRGEGPEKLACCGFPDADVVTLARLVKGEACPFGVALWWECDRVGRPCYEVGFVGGKVDEADKAVGETLDTVPRCTAPDLDSLAMEGGEVCPKG
jgi:hypothetical protein